MDVCMSLIQENTVVVQVLKVKAERHRVTGAKERAWYPGC